VRLWCEHWNVKIKEGETQTINFSRKCKIHEHKLKLNGENNPFVGNEKYLGVIFDRGMT
jgi:hypothetical protein